MKIYLISFNPQLLDSQIASLKKMGDLTIINAKKLSAKDILSKAKDVEVLIAGPSGVEKLDSNLLENLKQLKHIALLTVGHEWVDLIAAKKLNISVSTIKGATAESVAEHTWGMILNLAKRISEFNKDAREKNAFKFSDYTGKEVFGKTLGVIGLGDIGKRVAEVGKAFNMQAIGLNKSGKPVNGVELVDLNTLLKKSDVISICLPLNSETKNIIGEKEIKEMKKGVILVNCAREQIVDRKAIIKAVSKGDVFGYGVETDIMTLVPKEYFSFPNIIATPHNGFNTEDAERKSFDLVIKNIKLFLN
jgi:phosphoglycerate dehydrogenase-like enzyme